MRALLHKSRFVVARSAFCDEAIQFFMHRSETGLLRPEKRPRNDDFFVQVLIYATTPSMSRRRGRFLTII